MVDWRVTARRSTNFVRTIFKSKMAIAGVVILVIFSFLAIGAPLVTPYNPTHDVVAAPFSPPSWYRYFNEGRTLSENTALESNPTFTSAPTIITDAAQATATTTQGYHLSGDSHITAAYSSDTSFQTGAGSIKITLDRSGLAPGTYTTTLKKVFNWPYLGPPYRFIGSLSLFTPTASQSEPVGATIFLERITSDHEVWNLTDNSLTPNTSWGTYPFTGPCAGQQCGTNTPSWQTPSTLDSSNLLSFFGTSTDPSQIIFSSKDTYAYGIVITYASAQASTTPLTVYVTDVNLKLVGTSWGLLGTDWFGYDIASQVIYGARISLEVGLLSAFIGITLGLFVGLMAGYLGKVVDEVLMRFTDMLLVIPGLPLLIVLVAVLGNNFSSSRLIVLILVIGFLGWMGFARVVRAQVLSLKERPFVEAARAAGAGAAHITTSHIIPNIVGLIYVNLALAVPGAILSEAALSFLGLGDPTVLSWGSMLNECCTSEGAAAPQTWWWVLPPGFSIALVSLAFVMIGFSLDTLFNPRLRQRR